MQIFPSNRTGVSAEIGSSGGDGQQPGSGGARAAVRGQFLLQKFPHERVDCGLVLGGVNLGCPEKILRKIEGNVPRTHINKCNT
jgi:hypothetical protein